MLTYFSSFFLFFFFFLFVALPTLPLPLADATPQAQEAWSHERADLVAAATRAQLARAVDSEQQAAAWAVP